MKDKIQARQGFEDEIKEDPIKLLKAFMQHALNYQEDQFDMAMTHLQSSSKPGSKKAKVAGLHQKI